MKFIQTSDWHLSKYPKYSTKRGISEKLRDIFITMRFIADYAIDNNINSIVISGDILHNKSIIYSQALDGLLSYFECYKNIDFILLDGNHDLSDYSKSAVSSLKSLSNVSNVYCVPRNGVKVDDIFFVPFSIDMIDIIKKGESKYLVSHFGLNEALLNSGVSIISDLSCRDLRGKYRYALLGHYHLPQYLCAKDLQIYYTGSIVQLDWGEKHEDKRFLVVDTETDIIESVLTEGYKKYFLLEVSDENFKEVIEEAKKLQEQKHYVTVNKIDKRVDTREFEKSGFIVIDKTDKDITNRGITTSMSTEDKFKKFVEIKEIPENERDEYVKVALEVVEEASKMIEGET